MNDPHEGDVQATPTPLGQSDRELLMLVDELQHRLNADRSLIEDGPAALGLTTAECDDAKRDARKRLERLYRAFSNLRDETGAPYRDARMLLTGLVLTWGNWVRDYRAGEGASAYDPAGEKVITNIGGTQVLAHVALLYPALKGRMSESARIEAATTAIAGAAGSASRVPWPLIAAVWHGIGQDHDPERWRKDWNEHCARQNQ